MRAIWFCLVHLNAQVCGYPEWYARGTMPGWLQAHFERHFFECERCTDDTEAAQDWLEVAEIVKRGSK